MGTVVQLISSAVSLQELQVSMDKLTRRIISVINAGENL